MVCVHWAFKETKHNHSWLLPFEIDWAVVDTIGLKLMKFFKLKDMYTSDMLIFFSLGFSSSSSSSPPPPPPLHLTPS